MKSLLRHQYAYRIASEWSGSVLTRVADLAKGYPIELRTSGTLQVLAFSLGKSGHATLAETIAAWVLSRESGAPLGVFEEQERSSARLLQRLAEAPRAAYLAADSEAIAFADALKIVTQALVKAKGVTTSGSNESASSKRTA